MHPHPQNPQVKLTISYALAQSTKLSLHEKRVMQMVLDTKHLPEALAATGKVRQGVCGCVCGWVGGQGRAGEEQVHGGYGDRGRAQTNVWQATTSWWGAVWQQCWLLSSLVGAAGCCWPHLSTPAPLCSLLPVPPPPNPSKHTGPFVQRPDCASHRACVH